MTIVDLLNKLKEIKNFEFYRIDKYQEDDFDIECFYISHLYNVDISKIQNSEIPECFIEIPFTGNSDYSGATYCGSNRRRIKKDFPFVSEVYGHYSYAGLYIQLKTLINNPELIKVIEKLNDYIIYDEDDDSELNTELQEEAFNNCLKHDLIHELNKISKYENLNETTHEISNIFWELEREAGIEWTREYNYVYLDVQDLISEFRSDRLNEIIDSNRIENEK